MKIKALTLLGVLLMGLASCSSQPSYTYVSDTPDLTSGSAFLLAKEYQAATELYVEPGVPHAYEYFDGTPQTERFYRLRDNATARMLGRPANPSPSAIAPLIRHRG